MSIRRCPHPTLSQTHFIALTGASRTASDPDSQATRGLCPSLPAGESEKRAYDSTALREIRVRQKLGGEFCGAAVSRYFFATVALDLKTESAFGAASRPNIASSR